MSGTSDGVMAGARHAAPADDASRMPSPPRHIAAPDVRRLGAGRVAGIVALAVLAVAALAYLAGVLAFSRLLFLPNTTLNGEDVSLALARDVASAHSSRATGYALEVTGEGVELRLSAADVSLATDGDAYVASALSQVNPWAWPQGILSSRSIEVERVATFDEAAARSAVERSVAAANEGSTPPTAAHVAYNEAAGAYEVVPSAPGTQVDQSVVCERVLSALSALETRVTLTDEALALEPEDDADALEAAVRKANACLGATQTLRVGGVDAYELGSAQLAGWVRVADDLTVTLDGAAMAEWATGELSEALDSTGSTRAYTRPDGKACTVAGGSYGWTIDGTALAAQLAANVEAGTAATVEVPLLQSAVAFSPGGQDWGARYIDIDLAEQYVRLYDDAGALAWESACVSGNAAQGHNTPTGVYAINDYMRTGNVELRGEIDPATNEPEYISYVTYWMPFIGNMVALHDASWRGSFGGSIYRTNGSHGCVNLPTRAAASLYGLVHVGDVVVVHW